MTRVLHFVHWPKTGITSLLTSIFEANKSSDIESYIFILAASDSDVAEFSGLVGGAFSGGVDGFWGGFKKFLRVVKELAPHVIHTHSYTPSIIVSLCCRHFLHVRTVHSVYPYFSARSLLARFKRRSESAVLDNKRVGIVCVSEGVKNALPYRFRRASLTVIRDGLNIDKVLAQAGARGTKTELFGIAEDKLIICSVGRLEQQKGYDVLVAAFALIPESVRQRVMLVLIGEGSCRAALEAAVASAGLHVNVLLLGHRQNPYPLLQAADIYVCSSRYEGYGISLAEAMVLGLPVATTLVSGIPEMIVDGENGVVIKDLNAAAVAAALRQLIDDAELRARIAAESTRLALRTMGIAQVADEYSKLYRRMLDGD